MSRLSAFLAQPVRLWTVLVLAVTLIVGFGIGFGIQQDTSSTASAANRGLIDANQRLAQEIATRVKDECVKTNTTLDALRQVIETSFSAPASARVKAPPFPAHPEVQAYIQDLLDGLAANSNAPQRDRVLAAVPPDANCH